MRKTKLLFLTLLYLDEDFLEESSNRRRFLMAAGVLVTLFTLMSTCTAFFLVNNRAAEEQAQESAAIETRNAETLAANAATAIAATEAAAVIQPTNTVPPTVAPTNTPAPTSQLTADNGSLNLGPIGLGTTELTYPLEIHLNEPATLELIIAFSDEIASANLISAETVAKPESLTTDEAAIVNRALGADTQIEYETEINRITIYPVMGVKLEGTGFEVVPNSTQIQEFDIKLQTGLIWKWTVTAREPGPKTLLLTIFLPIAENDQLEVKRTRTLSSFTINIDVLLTPTPIPSPVSTPTPQPPTPTPTATPSFIGRFIDNLANEPSTLIGGILTFVIGAGTLIITILNYRKKQEEPQPPAPTILKNEDEQLTLQIIVDNFNEQELRDLCFELRIDYDNLPFPGKASKARELIGYCIRHGRYEELFTKVREERPHLFSQEETEDDENVQDIPADEKSEDDKNELLE